MKLTKVSNDENNNSFFEVIGDIPFEKNDMLGSLSETIKVKELLFHEFTDKLQVSWHTPPFGPVYVIFMSGKQEITISTGGKKIFGVGDIVLFEDTAGSGHSTIALEAGRSVILKV